MTTETSVNGAAPATEQADSPAKTGLGTPATEQAGSPGKTGLGRWRWPLMLLVPLAVLAGIYVYLSSSRYQSTDDAYTQAGTVSVSANIAGRVVEINVRDNQIVQRGTILYRLDDAPLRIAVSEAKARLAANRLQIESLKSAYRQRQVDLRSARDTLAYAQSQFDRQKRLLASGIASQAQFDQASNALDVARQQVAGAQQQIGVALANLDNNPDITPEQHPLVQEAQAALDRAQLNLSYTEIPAPIDGVVAKVDQLQVGDYIAASTPVFALVSNHDVWIEANFKEVQLAQMRAGQSATVKIDRFPGRRFSATVASVSPSTGSQFSLLPPENATGNWVKVVQRVPVRLTLADADAASLLQSGLSADVTVDTKSRDARGSTVAASR